MKIKKVLLIILLIAIIVGAIIAMIIPKSKIQRKKETDKLNITVTSFSSYDFIKQIAKDNVNLTFILKPGVEAHNYEPTVSDIITIQNSDIFIYMGGEMEQWVDKVIESTNLKNTKLICLADYIDVIKEQEIDGAEEEHEEEEEGAFDEHIWSSPENSIEIIKVLTNILIEEDNKNKEKYEQNSNKYIIKIKELQEKIQAIVDNRMYNRLVFADRMPMQYFINEFGLEVSAAFSGCSTQAEPSSSTIAYLITKIKEENIPVVLYIELSDGKIAKTIANETGTKAMQIQSLHNISKEDFENGETYLSLMTRNLRILKEALGTKTEGI